ncbi:MAG: two-component system sensor histidine kinase CbrA [Candidatus Pelagadaptatus aseana]|uniref:ATP-binding protein n=1 Tax=Candidatus Pelagadaptatus aseana TaxID=3120508 RepID=UPI0039B1732C
MTFSITEISVLGILYTAALFLIAFLTDRGVFPERWSRHPLIYILSTGVVISAWAYYGVVDLAFQFGYGSLAYYLGSCALFLFAPVVLLPLVQLARRFQLRSLADLMVFRYHSQAAGALTAICLLVASLPIIALQIQAVADTVQIMTANKTAHIFAMELPFRDVVAIGYCAILAMFTVIYGHNTRSENSLMLAMAAESLIKVIALGAVGLAAIYYVFGDLQSLDQWLLDNPNQFDILHQAARDSSSHALLVVFCASAVTLPQLFHMASLKSEPGEVTATLSWGFPLMLLFLALPIFPIMWAGFELGTPLPPQYFTIGVPLMLESKALSILAFLGGISAATGALMAITIHLSTMLMNHWVLPFTPIRHGRLHRQLQLTHSVVAITLFAAGYGFYRLLANNYSLTDMALMYFIGTLQFLPGIFSVSFWPGNNSKGFMAGLTAGIAIWAIGMLLPAITGADRIPAELLGHEIQLGVENWQTITLWSLTLNIILMFIVSSVSDTSEEERYSAELCTDDELSHPLRRVLSLHSVQDFVDQLAQSLGDKDANLEVMRALEDLKLSPSERRPYALRRLRDQLEINLSGLMGTTMATELVNRHIPYSLPEGKGSTDINLIESRLSEYRNQLTGMAAELDDLRLFHRNTLERLPLATCSLGRDTEILMWNRAMEKLTGISAEATIGSSLESLPSPWNQLISDFTESPSDHEHNRQVSIAGNKHWLSLHKANIRTPANSGDDNQVILLEDTTEIQRLEQELIHSERLASIGRLAAGVAHEIGNPVTGIACLAQNLKYETETDDIQETSAQIVGQTERISRIVQSLVTFSHSGQHSDTQLESVTLRHCAEEAIQLLSLDKNKTQVLYINNIDPEHRITGDSQRLIQVFINLLSNARDASNEGDRVTVASELQPPYTVLEITDEGSGISEEQQPQVFEPFFTSKEPGEGTGLGLAMVYSIAEQHKAHIEIDSPPPGQTQGTRFTIKFPLLPVTTS